MAAFRGHIYIPEHLPHCSPAAESWLRRPLRKDNVLGSPAVHIKGCLTAAVDDFVDHFLHIVVCRSGFIVLLQELGLRVKTLPGCSRPAAMTNSMSYSPLEASL
jgi:hypothetical protein